MNKFKQWALNSNPVIWPTIVMIICGFYNVFLKNTEMPLWWWIMFIIVAAINIPWYIYTKVKKG